MEESLKSRVILILGLLTVILVVLNISSCKGLLRQKAAHNQEMATRMDLEEKVGKLTQDKFSADGKLQNFSKGLEEEMAAHQATKKALLQEQLVNQSLKEELQKVTKLKETLEEDLKEALVASKAVSKSGTSTGK